MYIPHVDNRLKAANTRLKLLYAYRHAFNYNMREYIGEILIWSLFNYSDLMYRPCIDYVTRGRVWIVQNACCRFVVDLKKYDHVYSYQKTLQWLPGCGLGDAPVTICPYLTADRSAKLS